TSVYEKRERTYRLPLLDVLKACGAADQQKPISSATGIFCLSWRIGRDRSLEPGLVRIRERAGNRVEPDCFPAFSDNIPLHRETISIAVDDRQRPIWQSGAVALRVYSDATFAIRL